MSWLLCLPPEAQADPPTARLVGPEPVDEARIPQAVAVCPVGPIAGSGLVPGLSAQEVGIASGNLVENGTNAMGPSQGRDPQSANPIGAVSLESGQNEVGPNLPTIADVFHAPLHAAACMDLEPFVPACGELEAAAPSTVSATARPEIAVDAGLQAAMIAEGMTQ